MSWEVFPPFHFLGITNRGFPGGSDGKECDCNVWDLGLIPEVLKEEDGETRWGNAARWKVKVKVIQSCPTLWDPMDYTVYGTLQARILEWVASPFSRGFFQTQGSNAGLWHCGWILYQLSYRGSPRILEWAAYSFSRESSWPRFWTRVFCIAGVFFTNWAIMEALICVVWRWGQNLGGKAIQTLIYKAFFFVFCERAVLFDRLGGVIRI